VAEARILQTGLWPSLDVLLEEERGRTGAAITETLIDIHLRTAPAA